MAQYVSNIVRKSIRKLTFHALQFIEINKRDIEC